MRAGIFEDVSKFSKACNIEANSLLLFQKFGLRCASLISEKFRISAALRYISLTFGSSDTVSVLLARLVMRGVVFGLCHFN